MTPSTRHAVLYKRSTLSWYFGIFFASNAVVAAPIPPTGATIPNGRYSVMAVEPSAGQRDLLSVNTAITIPSNIERVGEALHWILRDSGYRLAADSVLSDEVKALLELPLPVAHRHFEPMPLKTLMGLIIGPAFQIVQDPVHRLIAFERCVDTAIPTATRGAR
jgi:conjugative transfer region protein (TIGR03748 family)